MDEKDKNNGTYTQEGRRLRPRKPRIGGSQHGGSTSSSHHSASPQRYYSSDQERPSQDSQGSSSYNRRPSSSYQQKGGGSYGRGGSRPSSEEGGSYGRRPYGNGEGGSSYGRRPSHGEGGPQRHSSYRDRDNRGTEGGGYRRGGTQHRAYSGGPSRDSENEGQRRPYGGGARKQEGGSRRTGYGQGRRPSGAPGQGGGRSQGGKPFRQGGPKGPGRKAHPNPFEGSEAGINNMLERNPQISEMQTSDFDSAPVGIQEVIRLNKFIANSGVCSRREADQLIQAGVVTVNGEVVTELGTKVNILTDEVRFNGELLKGEEKVYIVLNKPRGYVTTASDPNVDKTVMDLIKGCPSRVFPVGRLDKNTTGVLLFTNDGEIAERLTHPSYSKKKIYQVALSEPLKEEDYNKILEGITLSDGDIKADELEYIDEKDHSKLGIEIHSGRNRIVRRIFESLGYDVKALDRVYFAGLTKKGLNRGEWRYLSKGEANILRMGSYM